MGRHSAFFAAVSIFIIILTYSELWPLAKRDLKMPILSQSGVVWHLHWEL